MTDILRGILFWTGCIFGIWFIFNTQIWWFLVISIILVFSSWIFSKERREIRREKKIEKWRTNFVNKKINEQNEKNKEDKETD
jgi:hypothetical protein